MNPLDILNNRFEELLAGFIRVLPQLGLALLIVGITWLIAKFAHRISSRLLRHVDIRQTLVNLVETLTGVVIWTIGLLIRAIKRALDNAGMEIPFPQRTLTFGDALRVERPAS